MRRYRHNISNLTNRKKYFKKKEKNNPLLNTIILLHKINDLYSISNVNKYVEYIEESTKKSDLKIKNLYIRTSYPSDVVLLYPNLDLSVLDPLAKNNKTINRQIKIFKLLEDIENNIKL